MKLFFRKLGEGPPMIILHGLFGSSDNWTSMARRFSDQYSVYLLDLRNHGQSPHSDIHDYPSMIEDLNEFITDQQIGEAVMIGHSMGGKVIMKYSIDYPGHIRKLIVVDMAPKIYKPRSKYIVDALLSLDLSNVKTREQADELLADKIKYKEIRQFLLKNLYRKDDLTFAWKLNLESLQKNLGSIGGYFTEKDIFPGEALFLQGETSNYILEEDYPLIKRIFPQAEIVKLAGAGHWLHIDQPDLTYEKINNFISG